MEKKVFNKEFINLKESKGARYGYMLDTIPQDVMEDFSIEVNNIKNNFIPSSKRNHTLAGQISKEYAFNFNKKLAKYIETVCIDFEKKSLGFIKHNFLDIPDFRVMTFRSSNNERSPVPHDFLPNLNISEAWCNFQEKGEYNPPHLHTGLLSFVIWYEIPYTSSEEEEVHKHKYTNKKADLLVNGAFGFLPSINDNTTNIPIKVDKSFNGTLCIFPSDLYHYVNPFFSSDDYRITISSNISFVDIYDTLDKMEKYYKK